MVEENTEFGVRQVPSVTFQDLKSLPPKKRRLIQSIKIDRSGSPVVELMDKSKAIETINRMLGYNAPDKKEVTGKNGEALFSARTLTPQEAKEYGLKLEEEY